MSKGVLGLEALAEREARDKVMAHKGWVLVQAAAKLVDWPERTVVNWVDNGLVQTCVHVGRRYVKRADVVQVAKDKKDRPHEPYRPMREA